MTNQPNDRQNNLVSFLRQNQPLPPLANPHLEQELMASLPPHPKTKKRHLKAIWTIPGAIATGFLFTSVSFSLKTPRIALESKELENFLVKNWQNTLDNNGYTTVEHTEAYWLLPTVSESQPALSSAQ